MTCRAPKMLGLDMMEVPTTDHFDPGGGGCRLDLRRCRRSSIVITESKLTCCKRNASREFYFRSTRTTTTTTTTMMMMMITTTVSLRVAVVVDKMTYL